MRFQKNIIAAAATALLLALLPISALAAESSKDITGEVYCFEEKNDYEFSSATAEEKVDTNQALGTLTIQGDITRTYTKNGVPAYKVGTDHLEISYTYPDTLLTANDDSWHIVNDKNKKIDTFKIDSDIQKGAIILQTSRDGINWIDDVCNVNAFADAQTLSTTIYETTDVQQVNDCYYRVIIVYETAIRTEIRKVISDKYDYKKYAEVYRFYVEANDTGEAEPSNTLRYSLGTVVKSDKGYSQSEKINSKDVHYGWTLGNFFVSGYTANTKMDDGRPVFIKNLGDTVTLWFNLQQDINGLNGNTKLSIYDNNEGYDEKFQIKKTDFGRGTLIVRYTDYENVAHDPIVYTNYLEANTSLNANTKVQLFDEGDYEVSLDYEIVEDKVLDTYSHYCISFKFSVRNGNCMVYPFDAKTGAELTNTAVTSNGFYLDLAKSRYLTINITREVLKDGANGLTEDTRFNRPAKDGDKYTDEGIYTITVQNKYTSGQPTTKKIYVGSNDILRAYMVTGKTIAEINELVSQGATINSDGTINIPEPEPEPEPEPVLEPEPETVIAPETETVEQATEETISEPETSQEPTSENVSVTDDAEEVSSNNSEIFPETDNSKKNTTTPFAIGAVVVVIVGAGVISLKKKQSKG